jgi:hypothetical protein
MIAKLKLKSVSLIETYNEVEGIEFKEIVAK